MSTYKEGPIMQEIHRIRDELFQDYKNSGLSYSEWWRKQEEKLNDDLLLAGFQIIQKNGVSYLVEIQLTDKNHFFELPL